MNEDPVDEIAAIIREQIADAYPETFSQVAKHAARALIDAGRIREATREETTDDETLALLKDLHDARYEVAIEPLKLGLPLPSKWCVRLRKVNTSRWVVSYGPTLFEALRGWAAVLDRSVQAPR